MRIHLLLPEDGFGVALHLDLEHECGGHRLHFHLSLQAGCRLTPPGNLGPAWAVRDPWLGYARVPVLEDTGVGIRVLGRLKEGCVLWGGRRWGEVSPGTQTWWELGARASPPLVFLCGASER